MSIAALALVAGCATGPRARATSVGRDEPHARVLLRVHDSWRSDALLEERVTIDGRRARTERARGGALLRVRPGERTLRLHTLRYDEAPRRTVEIRNETQPVSCSGDCPAGQRLTVDVPVAREVVVVDRFDRGGCVASLPFHAERDARYVVDYWIDGPNACAIECAQLERDPHTGRAITRPCAR